MAPVLLLLAVCWSITYCVGISFVDVCACCCGVRSVSSYLVQAGRKNNIKTSLQSMEKYQKFTYNFFGTDIAIFEPCSS